MALSIGGDGTLLGICRRVYEQNVPVCGINIGTFGFLADIELSELESKLDKIMQGEYYLEERMVISGYVESAGHEERFLGHAINDVVVTKGGAARMLQLGLTVNGFQVMDYKADGLIVSTATGSTTGSSAGVSTAASPSQCFSHGSTHSFSQALSQASLQQRESLQQASSLQQRESAQQAPSAQQQESQTQRVSQQQQAASSTASSRSSASIASI